MSTYIYIYICIYGHVFFVCFSNRSDCVLKPRRKMDAAGWKCSRHMKPKQLLQSPRGKLSAGWWWQCQGSRRCQGECQNPVQIWGGLRLREFFWENALESPLLSRVCRKSLT